MTTSSAAPRSSEAALPLRALFVDAPPLLSSAAPPLTPFDVLLPPPSPPLDAPPATAVQHGRSFAPGP